MAGKALFRFQKFLGNGQGNYQRLAKLGYKGNNAKSAEKPPATVEDAKSATEVNIVITHPKYFIGKFTVKSNGLYEFKDLIKWQVKDRMGQHNHPNDLIYTFNCGEVANLQTKRGKAVKAVVLNEARMGKGDIVSARIVGGIPLSDHGCLDTKIIVVPTESNDEFFKSCFEIDDLPKEQFHEVHKLLAKSQKLKNEEHPCLNSKEASEAVNSLEFAPPKEAYSPDEPW